MAVISVSRLAFLAVLTLAIRVSSFSADDFSYYGSRDSVEKSLENEISFRKPEPTRSTRVYHVTNKPHDPSVSLFDLLPNQGAYDGSGLTSVRRETTTSKPVRSSYNELESFTSRSPPKPTTPPRFSKAQRSSSSTSSDWYNFRTSSTARPFVKAIRLTTPAASLPSKNSKRSFGEIEIEHQPTSDLEVAYFNSHLLAPIVRKLTQAEQRSRNSQTVPILTPNSGGYDQGNRPVAEPAFAREIERRLQNFRQQPSQSYEAPKQPEPSAQSKFFVFTSEPNARNSNGGYNNNGQGGYSGGGYSNSPKPSYGPPAETTKPPQQTKNEIHYHYHITNNRIDPTSTTTTTTPRPSYGPPASTTTSAPPAQYGPPPKKTSEGYGGYQESFSNRDGFDTYNSYNNNGGTRIKQGAEVRVPIIRNNAYQQYQAPSFRDETTTSKPLDYNTRTLFTSLRAPDNTYSAYSNSAEPSPSYGPPEYTTSTTQPPPADLPRNPPAHTAQTSITLETIPITTTETRFVTVPKIVQTLGTTVPRQPEDFNNPPAAPPQYGPPDAERDRSASSGGQIPSNVRNIFDAHLAQLNPQPQVEDLSDADLIALLQQGSRQTAAPSASVVPQQPDLRNSFLLGNVRQFQPAFSNPAQQFQPSAFGLQNVGFQQSNRANIRAQSPGSTTVLTGEAVGAVSDIIREQRLEQVISELQGRLRQQNRNIDRNRQSFRNVFLTGAALMAGLTLIPSTALLGGGAAATAAATPLISSASLVPFTAGKRRKRSLGLDELVIDVPVPIESRPVRVRTSAKVKTSRPEAATTEYTSEKRSVAMLHAEKVFKNSVKVDQAHNK